MNRRTQSLVALLALAILVVAALWLTRSPARGSSGLEVQPEAPALESAPVQVRAARESGEEARRQEALRTAASSAGEAAEGSDPSDQPPLSWVSGRVLDTDEHPLEGADVLVGDPWGGERLLGRSVADGSFRVPLHERPDSFVSTLFTVFAEGFEGARKSLQSPCGEELRLGTFRLKPGGEVRGRVVDELGHPLRQAWVEWLPTAAFPTDPIRARADGIEEENFDATLFHGFARSDSEGRFWMRGLPRGGGFLVGSADGRSHAWTPLFEVRGTPLPEQELVLGPSATAGSAITGLVQDPQGAPVACARIQWREDEQWSDCALASQEGRFLLEYGRVAAVDLRAVDPQERWAFAVALGVTPGTSDLVLRLGEPRWLVVLLVDPEQRPVPWGHVSCEPPLANPLHDTGRTGSVRIQRPLESFTLQGSAPGFRTETFGPFDPATASDELRLTLRPGQALRGRILQRGRPVVGARLDLAQSRDPGTLAEARGVAPRDQPFLITGSVELGRQDGTSAADGAFLLTIHDDGWHSLRVEADGFPLSVFGPFALRKEAETAPLTLELERGGAIEGRVLLTAEQVGRELLVAACGGWNFVHTAPIEADGTFHLENLAPGPYQLRACEPPLASLQPLQLWYASETELEWDCLVRSGERTRHDLDLTAEGSVVLSGRLTLAEATPSEWTTRLLSEKPEPGSWRMPRAEASVDAQGGFQLRLSRPGRYFLVLGGADATLSVPLELHLGENQWSHRLETGRVRVRRSAIGAASGGNTFLRYSAGEVGKVEFLRLHQARLHGPQGEDVWVFDAPLGAGRLEEKANFISQDEPWQLVRAVEVARDAELLIE